MTPEHTKTQPLIPLIDTYGRVHRDLRISVTDRCNFRCQYCMPEEGLKWLPREELLSFEEIYRVAALCVNHFGITSIRLTGGEPTLRAQLPKLVEMLSGLKSPIPSDPTAASDPSLPTPLDLAMTTNGFSLKRHAGDLKSAGLDRINISLDSLKRDRFQELTRRDELAKVLEGISAARSAGFDPVKINMVVMRGINDDEILDFAEFGRREGVIIRFIEFMPLDADEIWSKDKVVGLQEIRDQIAEVYPVKQISQSSEPVSRFQYLDMAGAGGTKKGSGDAEKGEGGTEKGEGNAEKAGEFGVIASVTQSFCHLCDRVRLTSDGKFRNCLFSLEEYDLREIMRSGKSDDELAEIISRAVHNKWEGHNINQSYFIRPSRSMSQIGG